MRKFQLGLVAAAVIAGAATPAHAQEGRVLGEDSPQAAPGYVVLLKDGVSVSAVSAVSAGFGVTTTRVFGSVNGFAASMTAAQARRLAADPSVALVQRNQRVTVSDAQNNPPTWGLDRIDQRVLPLDQTYYYRADAATVSAYIIDTGVRTTHQTFGGRAKHGYDSIDNDNDATDCHGHGTHVGGTVGGAEYGVAKKVTLYGVRVLDCRGSGTTETVVAGIDWVTANAKKPAVANMSLGGNADAVLDAAAKRSIDSGVTYAIAAGNDNGDACGTSPAREPSAITVGATARDDGRAWFSNYGTCVDIFAPGLGILSSWHSNDTATLSASGTSMASPHVAGAAALFLAINPKATPQQVRDALVGVATPDLVTNPGPNSPNKLLYTAHGIVPPPPPPGCGRKVNDNDVEIPDAGEPISSAIRYAGCAGKAPQAAKVEVHVKHSYKGDLKIDLVGPSGRVYPLKAAGNGQGGGNLDAVYTVDLSGESKNGAWQLVVRDRAEGDTGHLDSWAITLPKK